MSWKDDKNLGPWVFSKGVWPTMGNPFVAEHVPKPSYNEGDHLATYANPVWSMEEGSNIPITPTHKPCGYWTKDYVPPPTEWTPPSGPYLIGWYKFDEGSGLVAANSAIGGNLGGGLLPNLIVENTTGNFWTGLNGFAYTGKDWQRAYAYKDLGSTRSYGGTANGFACYGIFCRRSIGVADFGCLCSLFKTNTDDVFSGTEFDPTGVGSGGFYEHNGGWQGSTGQTPLGSLFTGRWYFLFIDNLKKLYAVRDDGTLITGQAIIISGVVSLQWLHTGVRYHLANMDGRYGVHAAYGDWLIYNFKILTLSEWAEWYDQLRSRYGMAARSGW